MHRVVHRALDGSLRGMHERVVGSPGARDCHRRVLTGEPCEPGAQGRVLVAGVEQVSDTAGVNQAGQCAMPGSIGLVPVTAVRRAARRFSK
jgi:hypothetical protein